MLTRFYYDKKKAKKIYRHRCWTRYRYLSVAMIIGVLGIILSCTKHFGAGMIVSFALFFITMIVRGYLASTEHRKGTVIDITDEYLFFRYVSPYVSNKKQDCFIEQNKVSLTIEVPLVSIHNVKIDKEFNRIEFDYLIFKRKAHNNKRDKKDKLHMVLDDVYDKSIIDALKSVLDIVD